METNIPRIAPRHDTNNEFLERVMAQARSVEMSRKEMREHVFCAVVFERLMRNFEEDMEDLDYSEDEISEFQRFISGLDEDGIKRMLSIPHELRRDIFKNFREKIDEDGKRFGELLGLLHEYSRRKGYTVGYHASKQDIPKERNGNREGWNIRATELDDRDDMLMAYYSLDYEHVFRMRHPKYIYVVRAETSEESSHKKDQSNNWGRASSLSVVDRFDIREVDGIVEKMVSESAESVSK